MLKKDRHLKENIGNKVQVKLFKPLAGKKVFEGLLESFSDDNICIKIESQILEIERSNIGQIKTVFDWN